MNVPAIHSNVRSLHTAQFHMDVEPMSRVDSRADRSESRFDAALSTMSYPQRIKMMIARAPSPPPLRRVPQAARTPMSEETRAMLLYVHTAHATDGSPTAPQTH